MGPLDDDLDVVVERRGPVTVVRIGWGKPPIPLARIDLLRHPHVHVFDATGGEAVWPITLGTPEGMVVEAMSIVRTLVAVVRPAVQFAADLESWICEELTEA